ncbi:carbamoyltransferase HypF [Poseidonocella sp. HB161398]|uniref:carbamoyltransferase HypF n=1 Tax=Poseidonocella sp. HB161398 TaxID=2320855 RepID=UPI0011097DE5|nr:carbamoyltransferase HypF [Poseidonocella sp. HB161398]
MSDALQIRVRGQVQGVGFRPFVWQLAQRFGLRGEVLNDAEGVLIRAAGEDLPGFLAALEAEAPPLARIDLVETAPLPGQALAAGFAIAASGGPGARTRVTPDAATCPACLAEIRDPADRRYGYAFANCTHCGPRFSILRGLPYDRAQTTMAAFPLCPACRAEYGDPADRRFHAQPVACPDCGPRLWIEPAAPDPVRAAAARLKAGETVAVKGLGGFHLAVDATQGPAVQRLRDRKRRPAKPFALMATMAMIRALCHVSEDEAALLADPAAPIVLLARRGRALPDAVAPGQPCLGVMLPATPLHHLLLDAVDRPLVMTSGNLSGEPQVTGNAEAREKLAGFADCFVMHDRGIARRLDDSVERITPQGPMVLRRARGRVPGTLRLPPGFGEVPQIAAFGGQMKGAICLLKDGQALLGHHLGDLDSALSADAFEAACRDYAALFGHRAEIAACDLHPGFRATRHAEESGLPVEHVQHHHAHMAACLGENLWPLDGGPVAAIVLDGLGLGTDGTAWGGELLLGGYRQAARVAHLRPAPLPGGDAAAREPWRNLVARLDQAGLPDLADALLPEKPLPLLRHAMERGLNAPLSSSAGRLFDAFAAACGLAPDRQSFEGEAAMALEAAALQAPGGFSDPYPISQGRAGLDPAPLFAAWAGDRRKGVAPGVMAARFHAGLARAFATEARALVEAGAAQAVALSGGCFQNATLLALVAQALEGVPLLLHRQVPANDGGLAFGQALVAAARVAPPEAR